MNKIEAQIIIENTGNYDDEETEDIMQIYDKLTKHIGFEDRRRDSRFVVKFHDIFYYTPDGCEAAEMDNLFEIFCEDMYDNVLDQAEEKHICIDDMLHPMYVGHYQAFMVYIPEITKESVIDLAMKVYDEYDYKGVEYVEDYINLVNILQDLEDNYMEYWIDFITDCLPEETVKEISDMYHKDMERRKATQTLAK